MSFLAKKDKSSETKTSVLKKGKNKVANEKTKKTEKTKASSKKEEELNSDYLTKEYLKLGRQSTLLSEKSTATRVTTWRWNSYALAKISAPTPG